MSLPSLARVPAPPDPILGLAEALPRRPARREDQPVVGRVHRRHRHDAGARHGHRGRATPGGGRGHEALPADRRRARLPGARPGAGARRGPRGGDVRAGRSRPRRRAARAGCGSPPTSSGPTGGGQTIWMSEPTWPNHPHAVPGRGVPVRPLPVHATRRGAGSTRRRCWPRWRRRRPATSCCSTARATTRPAWTRRPTCGGGSATSSRSGGCCRSSTSPTRASATGSREDAAGLLELVRPGVELLVSTSFSKTFSLYAERVGAMLVIAGSRRRRRGRPVARQGRRPGQLLEPARARGRRRPDDPRRRGRSGPAGRPSSRRCATGSRTTGARWSRRSRPARSPATGPAIADQRGMFALLGLSTDQVARLRDEHAVYVVGRGRINVAGFTAVEPRPVRRRPRRGARHELIGRPRPPRGQLGARSISRPDQRRRPATRAVPSSAVERVPGVGRVGLAELASGSLGRFPVRPRPVGRSAAARCRGRRRAASSARPTRTAASAPSRAPAEDLLDPPEVRLELGRDEARPRSVLEHRVDPPAGRATDRDLRASPATADGAPRSAARPSAPGVDRGAAGPVFG